MNEFKVTFIVKNQYTIETQRNEYSEEEIKSLNSLLRTQDFDLYSISIKSKRRAMNGYYFVDFESTNNLTIKENLRNFSKRSINKIETSTIYINEDFSYKNIYNYIIKKNEERDEERYNDAIQNLLKEIDKELLLSA